MLTREVLFERPDWHDDDCDICHQFAGQLWEDVEQPGEFMICADCIRREASKQEERVTAYNLADYNRDYPNGE